MILACIRTDQLLECDEYCTKVNHVLTIGTGLCLESGAADIERARVVRER